MTPTTDSSPARNAENVIHIGFITEATEQANLWIDEIMAVAQYLTIPSTLKMALPGRDTSLQQVNPDQIVVAQEAYDFYRWTDHRIDSSLLQDAYDEYCGF